MSRSKLGPAQSKSSRNRPQTLLDNEGSSAVSLLRQIPSVDELLSRAALGGLEARVGRRALVDVTRKVLDGLRNGISSGAVSDVSIEALEREIAAAAEAAIELSL